MLFENKDEFRKRYYLTKDAIENDKDALELFKEVEKHAIEYVESALNEEIYKRIHRGNFNRDELANLDDSRRRKHNVFLDSIKIFNRYVSKFSAKFPNYPHGNDVFKDYKIDDRARAGDWAMDFAKVFYPKLIKEYREAE